MKLLIGLILIILTGCAAQPHDNLGTAEYLYKNKCGGCHKVYNKDSFSGEKWSKILSSMKIKARLTETEEHVIKDYLTN